MSLSPRRWGVLPSRHPGRRHPTWAVAHRIWVGWFGLGAVAIRYSPAGFPLVVVADPWYRRDPEYEVFHGEELAEMLLKRSDIPQPKAGQGSGKGDPRTETQWPLLWSHLTQTQWDDGTTRETSSLVVFHGDGSYKVMLKDKAAGLCLWVAAPSLCDLWHVLEEAIGSDSADWRVDKHANQKPPSKKGKAA